MICRFLGFNNIKKKKKICRKEVANGSENAVKMSSIAQKFKNKKIKNRLCSLIRQIGYKFVNHEIVPFREMKGHVASYDF